MENFIKTIKNILFEQFRAKFLIVPCSWKYLKFIIGSSGENIMKVNGNNNHNFMKRSIPILLPFSISCLIKCIMVSIVPYKKYMVTFWRPYNVVMSTDCLCCSQFRIILFEFVGYIQLYQHSAVVVLLSSPESCRWCPGAIVTNTIKFCIILLDQQLKERILIFFFYETLLISLKIFLNKQLVGIKKIKPIFIFKKI